MPRLGGCVLELPQTRYVSVGDAQVAYQVVGDGPRDLLWCYGVGSHIDLIWLEPRSRRVLEDLASVGRLILFDRRGVGASDAGRRGQVPTWEELAEDITAVLDAAGSSRTAVMASLEVGPIAILYAAAHPERVTSLVLMNTSARYRKAEDYPIGVEPDAAESILTMLETIWGTEELTRLGSPGLADDAEFHTWTARMNRASATPRSAVTYMRDWHRIDVRPMLPLINVPTLVVHAADNPMMPVALGRYLADHIPDATMIEVPGADLGHLGHDETIADIVEFLTGVRHTPVIDRVLATVLFTDIVGSTERASQLGDRRWRDLIDAHDRAVRRELQHFRGREIHTTGDGVLATFDGPGRAIACACAIRDAVRALDLEVRAGLHTGEIEVRGADVAGVAVHIGARVAATAEAGEVLVSSTVKDLVVGSGIGFDDRGEHTLKGIPGTWRLYAVAA